MCNGADTRAQAVNGSFPIHFAAACNGTEVMKLLLNFSKSQFSIKDHINVKDNENQTPLHKAALNGHKKVRKWYKTEEISCSLMKNVYFFKALALCLQFGGNHANVQV